METWNTRTSFRISSVPNKRLQHVLNQTSLNDKLLIKDPNRTFYKITLSMFSYSSMCHNKVNVFSSCQIYHSILPSIVEKEVFVTGWHGQSHKPINNAPLI